MYKKPKLLVLALSSFLFLSGCSTPATSSNEGSKENSSDTSLVSSLEGSKTTSSSSNEASSSNNQSSSEAEESSSASSSSNEAVTYSVEVTKDEGVRLSGLEAKYEAGANVTFTLVAESGFAIQDVKAVSGVNEIVLTKGENGVYSFVMPKRGVAITITTNRLSYKLTTGDPGNFIASIKQKKVGAADFSELGTITETIKSTEEGEESSEITFKTAEFGATIKVELQQSEDYLLTSVSVNGEVIDLKGQMSFSFEMPAKDSSIRIEKEDMPIAITKVESDHFSLTLYKEDKVTQIDNLVAPYSEVYVKADPKENNADGRYSIKSLSYSYKNNNGNIATEDITKSIDDDADGYYHFRAPKYDNLTVTVTEYDTTAYTDYSFVGDYLMWSTPTSASDIDDFTNGNSLSIKESGEFSIKTGSKTKTAYIDNATVKTGEGVASLSNGGSGNFVYDDKVVVGNLYCDAPVVSSSFIYVAMKKENKGDADDLYTMKGTQFIVDSITYDLVCFYRGGTLYESVLVVREKTDSAKWKNTITLDVDVSMIKGDFITSAKAIYEIKKNGVLLQTIGYKDEGGATNRIFVKAPYGDFQDSDNNLVLFLDGNGKASYDDSSFDYTLGDDGVSIALDSNLRNITGTIDAIKMTFKKLTDISTEVPTLPGFAGGTYQGSFYDSYDDSYTFLLIFDEKGEKVTPKTDGYNNYFAVNGKEDVQNVTYDAASGELSFSVTSGFGTKSMTFVYSSSNDTITCKTDQSSFYKTSNCVLKRKAN